MKVIKKPLKVNTEITLLFLFFFISFTNASPKIVFEKKTFNFGEIIQGENVDCFFHFKNDGDTTLKIIDVRSTCGCAVTELKKKLIEPGERGTIKVVFYSKGRQGKISKSIFVTTNDKENRVTRLAIVGIVKKTWNCEPKNVDFGEIKKDRILIDTVIISSVLVDTIRIDSITTEPAKLTAKIVSHKVDTVSLEVTLDPSEIKWRFVGVVRFYSNINKERKITIPVYARLKEKKEDQ
ncbi:DUF1573 domain-containing protein [candidate division WOR-3 bacterium]|nr:DUF1573 domain-containing protein [candidate division WOR-3 bacterium]